MIDRGAKRIVLGVVFAVVGLVVFYLLGEATGGSGLGSAAIFLAIFVVFLVAKALSASRKRDAQSL